MELSVIIALILAFAGVISSMFFGYIPNIRKNRIENQERKINTLLKDIDLLLCVEIKIIDELSEVNNENKETLKKRIRKIVSDEKGGRVLSDNTKPSYLKKQLQKYDK